MRNQAGGILDDQLDEIGVHRDEVYITNLVMCRPTKTVNGRPRTNRAPSRNEIENWAEWLDVQVRLVRPKLIVPLGVLATSGVLGRSIRMREVHGKPIPGRESVWKDPAITIIPTYHPAGIRGSKQRLQAFQEDLRTIRDLFRRL